MSQPPPDALIARLREASRLLLTSHTNPDGDAIGTELGLARLLEGLGKSATVWNRDPAPAPFAALAGAERIHVGEVTPPGFPERFDAVVFLECPSPDRCGLEDQLSALPAINLDHHLGNQLYGVVNWVDTAAPAVGEMVFRLAEAMRLPIDETTADLLHLALVSDTGSFRYSNATPEAFESAARMVRTGASPERVARTLYDQRPLASLKLLAEVTSALSLSAQGAVATAVLSRAMFERAGAGKGDSEGLIDTLRSLAGVEAVALLREIGDRELKVSLRSRGRIDVEAIARRRGGGGHRNAAGCTVSGDAEALRAELAAELAAVLDSE
ncbi:MAG TPA: DHH family phosphoesterase [Thermoanaerobaculia bacterium]|nr:DHH family phosphoesterase [Thermoanaerobaculia bacterium]